MGDPSCSLEEVIKVLISVITTPLIVSVLAIYSTIRLREASELELILVNLLFVLMILFPRLRSKLLRRRTYVNGWVRESHWAHGLLQGGSFYLIIQLCLSLPMAFILLVELQHITIQSWYALIPISLLSSIVNLSLRAKLSSFTA